MLLRLKRETLLADRQHAGQITRIREICFQGTYLEILVFGSVDSHHFSSVVDHFWCRRVSSVWAHDVGHQDTVLIYRFIVPL